MYLYLYLDFSADFHVLVVPTCICSTCSLKFYLYLCMYLYLCLYLDPKYLKNTKYIQVQTSTMYSIKSYILYIHSSELCDDTIG